jgi:alkylated DNA repair dioxygenase AlkB
VASLTPHKSETTNGIVYIDNFINEPTALFEHLVTKVIWDERMAARKTASFGKSYNYSQIYYPFQDFLPELEILKLKIQDQLHFTPNNCLINYYNDGKSKMGYHSDQTDILTANTGIAIISLGAERDLKFRNIDAPEKTICYRLNSGSLIYMAQGIQNTWQHSIPVSDTKEGGLSLTFRNIK